MANGTRTAKLAIPNFSVSAVQEMNEDAPADALEPGNAIMPEEALDPKRKAALGLISGVSDEILALHVVCIDAVSRRLRTARQALSPRGAAIAENENPDGQREQWNTIDIRLDAAKGLVLRRRVFRERILGC